MYSKQKISLLPVCRSKWAIVVCFGLVAMLGDQVNADIVLGQVDSFTDANAAGWFEGTSSPNPPIHNIGSGADGLAGHLQNVADGSGSGGRLQMRNIDSRWQGNYLNAGVFALSFSADNRSGNATPFHLRIALRGPGGSFVSSPQVLNDGSGWFTFTYQLSALAYVADSGGTTTLNDTLTNVQQLEILSAIATPTFAAAGNLVRGDNLIGDLRVDNISAIPEPSTSVALFSAGLWGLLRRRVRRSD